MQAARFLTVLLVSFVFSATADSLVAQTVTHVPLYTFEGDTANELFGNSVSGAGDVNGDGTPDLIVGASGSFVSSNYARVFSGSDGSVLYNFDGDSGSIGFGFSVSGAGDVNGDGRADLIVGGNESARVLSGSDGSVLYNFDGEGQFGFSVSGAGDVNGDGFADLIVGALLGDTLSGNASVFSGSDGSVLYTFINGDGFEDWFGISVSSAGDVNGDGFADLIVGAPLDDNGEINGFGNGSASVFSGIDGSVLYKYNIDGDGGNFGDSVSGAGDVNGDGIPDLIVGAWRDDNNGSASVFSGSDGSVLYTFNGDSTHELFGLSVSGAGDVNGDGRADLIVGGSNSARVLSGSDGSVLYNFDGDSAGDNYGFSVSGAGDLNGDGIDDFIVGARFGGANDGGYARVFVSQITPNCLLGDMDLSGTIDFLDIQPFIAVLSGGTNQCEADCDQSGMVDFLDIQPFIAILSGQ